MKLPEKLMMLERQYIEARALMMRDSSVYAEVKIIRQDDKKAVLIKQPRVKDK